MLLDATQSQMVTLGPADHTALGEILLRRQKERQSKLPAGREARSPAPATSSCLVCSYSYFSKDL